MKTNLLPGCNITITTDELMKYFEVVEKCRGIIKALDESPQSMLITKDLNNTIESVREDIGFIDEQIKLIP